jgi:hypothetical protein
MRCLRVSAALVSLTLLSACASAGVVATNPAPAGGAGSSTGTSAAGVVSADAGVPDAQVAAGGWLVRLNGAGPAGATLTISPMVHAAAPAAVLASLAVLHAAVASDAGTPVQVNLRGGAMPPGGATLTRTLPAPLPAGRLATLASFDPAHQAWVPVATTLSADRRTLSAHVSHFSPWDDIAYGAGWLLDTRVPAPSCQGRPPSWVKDTTFLDDRSSPLRWCAGADPKNPDVLVVKAAVNRSYGMALSPRATPAWMWDSMLQGGPDDFFVQVATKALALPGGDLAGKLLVAGGAQADFGFTQAQVRAAGGVPLLRAGLDALPALTGATYTALTRALAGGQGPAAALVTLIAVAQCGTTISRALAGGDWIAGAHAAITCLSANAQTISMTAAGILAKKMPSVAPRVLGKVVGTIGGKLWQVWAAGMLFQAMTWRGDSALVEAARTFNVFTTTPTPAGTRVLSVRPVDAAGRLAPGYTVSATVTASPGSASASGCSSGSEALAGAYRCFGNNNFIYDPCWAEGPAPSSVLCPARPWSTSVVRVRLSGPLEPPSTPEPGSPWGLRLSNGLKCVAAQGAHDSFNGKVVDYACGDLQYKAGNTSVLRGIDRSQALWRVQTVLDSPAGFTYTPGPVVSVAVAWYAKP